ncbi:putative histidine acid phosphatase [Geopyxis carbonaria]|nr:putative histidine acid phosphatase [Geopyxis carbonaria]
MGHRHPADMHLLSLILLIAPLAAAAEKFEALHHLGGNSPWFPGPEIDNLGTADSIPAGCTVTKAIYISRHGSRYPDPGAWKEWQALYTKLNSASFTARGALSFLPTWSPVLQHPSQDLAQLSLTGYTELATLGALLRFRYPDFYTPNTPFSVFANAVQRTTDSARLFARGYGGPNATSLGTVHVVNASHPGALADSLAPSDLCENYSDDSATATAAWDARYLPPITARLQRLIRGDLNLTDAETALMPYLCGFETQITGHRSPWCKVFTDHEITQYEYRQDLRYWYGTGPGSGLAGTMMLPVLAQVSEILENGQGRNLTVAFTHDGQINQLASVAGVFDGHRNLTTDRIMQDRTYRASRIVPMRGTVAWEKMSCTGKDKGEFVRVLLNDAVYPVTGCRGGPGGSCPLEEYKRIVERKVVKAGEFNERCGNEGNSTEPKDGEGFLLKPGGKAWVSTVAP